MAPPQAGRGTHCLRRGAHYSGARDGSPKGRDPESPLRDPKGSARDSPTGEAGPAHTALIGS